MLVGHMPRRCRATCAPLTLMPWIVLALVALAALGHWRATSMALTAPGWCPIFPIVGCARVWLPYSRFGLLTAVEALHRQGQPECIQRAHHTQRTYAQG